MPFSSGRIHRSILRPRPKTGTPIQVTVPEIRKTGYALSALTANHKSEEVDATAAHSQAKIPYGFFAKRHFYTDDRHVSPRLANHHDFTDKPIYHPPIISKFPVILVVQTKALTDLIVPQIPYPTER
jgi:hypothetical protein